MVQTDFTSKKVDEAQESFKNIKESIKGLYDILNLGLSEDEIYLKAGQENLEGLYRNILELILNDYGLRKLVKNIRNSNVDVNIVLEELVFEEEI